MSQAKECSKHSYPKLIETACALTRMAGYIDRAEVITDGFCTLIIRFEGWVFKWFVDCGSLDYLDAAWFIWEDDESRSDYSLYDEWGKEGEGNEVFGSHRNPADIIPRWAEDAIFERFEKCPPTSI